LMSNSVAGRQPGESSRSVVVVVAVVWGVAVSVMDVVDMVAVGDGDVAASFTVDVSVCAVWHVPVGFAVQPSSWAAAGSMQAAVVQIVDVVLMGDGDVPAVRAVLVRLVGVGGVVGGVSPQKRCDQLNNRAVVVECVDHRAAVALGANQVAAAKDAEMMGDKRLRRVQQVAQFGHPRRSVGKAKHQRKPKGRREGAKELRQRLQISLRQIRHKTAKHRHMTMSITGTRTPSAAGRVGFVPASLAVAVDQDGWST
jgi:hypothetical protein